MMGSRYAQTWQSQHGKIPEGFAAAEWGQTLAGMTREQIKQGMDQDRIRAGKWPPSSTEFLGMCHRVPELAAIKLELIARDAKRTPFAMLVWSFMDGFQFRQAAAEKANAMLRDAYELARAHVIGGGELPPELACLEHREEKRDGVYTRSVADAAMAACAKALGMKP